MLDLITDLATVLTIETGIISNIKDINTRIDQRKLQNLSADVDYEKIAKDLEIYAQAADDYIAIKFILWIVCGGKRIWED